MSRWIRIPTTMDKNKNLKVHYLGGISNFMKLLNLQHHTGKNGLGEIDYLYFDDVRPPKFCFCGIR